MHSRNCLFHGVKLSLPAAASLAATVMVLLMGNSEALAEKCKTTHGHFISQVFVPPGGSLPGGSLCTADPALGLFCVSGRAIGGLHGDFVSTLTSIIPSQDTPVTAVAFLTADLVLHTRDGDLLMREAAAYNTIPPDQGGHGDLGDVITVVGGTGKWEGATGRLRVWGNLTPTESDVNYEGEVCRP